MLPSSSHYFEVQFFCYIQIAQTIRYWQPLGITLTSRVAQTSNYTLSIVSIYYYTLFIVELRYQK
jgi:hypothetical protein